MLLKLDLFNNLLNTVKESNWVQNFISELSDYLESVNNKLSNQKNNINSLKQEGCLYQVVDMGIDGAYLQYVSNNKISYETELPLDKIGNDTVLRYQKNEYIIEEELTRKFFDNLVEINEYKEIQENFIKESNILKNNPDTKYKIEIKNENYCMLTYGIAEKFTIKVPNELIPFWAKTGENLYYANGKFNRDL